MNKATIKVTSNKDVSLLSVKTPINKHFTPIFEDIEIYSDIMDTVVFNGIHKTIAKHCLNRLYSKGNNTAYEILTHGTAILSFEDISSEILLAMYECRDSLEIVDNRLVITDDNAIKAIYSTCSKVMYQFMQKHYKHAYFEIDGQLVDIFNTRQLAQYTDFESVIASDTYNDFMEVVKKLYPKDYSRIKEVVNMRIDGLTYTSIAVKMHSSTSAINRLKNKIVECARALYR